MQCYSILRRIACCPQFLFLFWSDTLSRGSLFLLNEKCTACSFLVLLYSNLFICLCLLFATSVFPFLGKGFNWEKLFWWCNLHILSGFVLFVLLWLFAKKARLGGKKSTAKFRSFEALLWKTQAKNLTKQEYLLIDLHSCLRIPNTFLEEWTMRVVLQGAHEKQKMALKAKEKAAATWCFVLGLPVTSLNEETDFSKHPQRSRPEDERWKKKKTWSKIRSHDHFKLSVLTVVTTWTPVAYDTQKGTWELWFWQTSHHTKIGNFNTAASLNPSTCGSELHRAVAVVQVTRE